MTNTLATATAIFAFVSLCSAVPVRAQSSDTETEIVFAEEQEERAREQLRHLLSQYDLAPWIFTREVKIEAGATNQSHPILTLNASLFEDANSEEKQLRTFLHEQAHWFVYYKYNEGQRQQAAAEDLKQMYPNPPISEYPTYLHLIVKWVELDALAELIGEEKGRQTVAEQTQQIRDGGQLTTKEENYVWFNERVLEDTQQIGAILAKHDLIINPEKGLIVSVSRE